MEEVEKTGAEVLVIRAGHRGARKGRYGQVEGVLVAGVRAREGGKRKLRKENSVFFSLSFLLVRHFLY